MTPEVARNDKRLTLRDPYIFFFLIPPAAVFEFLPRWQFSPFCWAELEDANQLIEKVGVVPAAIMTLFV